MSAFDNPLVDVTPKQLKELGYVYWGKTIGENANLQVFCKKELYKKLNPVQLSTMDLLLKRNLFQESNHR